MSDIVERLNDNADLDAAEGADPTVVALEREAAAEIARLRTVEADNARLRSEVERLTRERDEAQAEVRASVTGRNAVGFTHRHVQVGSTVHTDESGIYSRVGGQSLFQR